VDIGNLIVGQYFEINAFNLNFTAANGTIHFISSFHMDIVERQSI
jgi:hypothetical protein